MAELSYGAANGPLRGKQLCTDARQVQYFERGKEPVLYVEVADGLVFTDAGLPLMMVAGSICNFVDDHRNRLVIFTHQAYPPALMDLESGVSSEAVFEVEHS